MTVPFVLELVFPLTLVCGALMLSPLLTRREVFFSITVAADFRDTSEAKRILRSFRLWLALWLAVFLAASWALWTQTTLRGRPLWVLVYLAGTYAAFYRARHRALPYSTAPSQLREASLGVIRATPFESLGWELLPFLILGFAAARLLTRWSEIPERFPVHYDVAGNPNGWANRTPLGVLGPLMIQLSVLALLLGTRAVMLRARRSRLSGPQADAEMRMRRDVSRALLGFGILSSLGISRLALNPIWPVPVLAMGAVMATIAIGLVVVLLGIVLRSRRHAASSGGDGTDEQHWKAGIFYVNPDDPAVFVEKRFGFGWTLNFGRPLAYVFMLAIVGFIGLSLLLSTKH